MAKVTIVYFSGYGHTAKQAEAVAEGARGVEGVEVGLVSVDKVNFDELKLSDAIIFGTPTYMGSAAAQFKAFMDSTSKKMMVADWRDKLAGGFTNSGSPSGDKLGTFIQLVMFANQHGMIWVGAAQLPGNNYSKGSPENINRLGFYLGAAAQSNADEGPDKAPPATDLRTARTYGARIAKIALQFARGKMVERTMIQNTAPVSKSIERTVIMNTASSIPTVPGTPFGGGFFTSARIDDGKLVVLITAPKHNGESEEIAWSELEGFCTGLKIGDFGDWRAPTRFEAMDQFRFLGQDNAVVDAFKPGGAEAFEKTWYWSDAMYAPLFAWAQSFNFGDQGNDHPKFGGHRVRAVREMILI